MKLLPPFLLALFVLAMVALHLWLPGPVLIDPLCRWLGAPLIVVGAALSVTGARHFFRIRTNINTFNEPTLLVTDGLFRWSRNPMYLGFITFLLGLGIALSTLGPLLLPPVFAVIVDRWYVQFEERAMRTKFGDAYEAYTRRTRRWL